MKELKIKLFWTNSDQQQLYIWIAGEFSCNFVFGIYNILYSNRDLSLVVNLMDHKAGGCGWVSAI